LIEGRIYRGERHEALLPKVAKTATAFERMRGLLGRSAPAAGEGLLISPCNSVHTLFMRFPIDVIFLNKEGRVIRIIDTMLPFKCAMSLGARSVLETGAGEAGRTGIQTGDHLVWEEGR
jgi:hypothetical protein